MNRFKTTSAGVASAQVGIEIVLFHDLPQGCPAHDLLFDRFDSLIGITGNRRPHQIGRNFLFLDQNGRHGFIGRRPEERDSKAEDQQTPSRQDNQRHVCDGISPDSPAALESAQNLLRG